MGRRTIEVQAESKASPEAVWRLLEDVTTWTSWAGFHEASYARHGTPPPHGLGAVRRFRAGPLRSRETVLAFEPPTTFSYDYRGTLPLRDYRADVTLLAHDGGTRITWHSEFESRLPLLGPLLERGLRRTLQQIANGLARAAEG